MKIYLVIETVNTGGVPPDGEKLAENVAKQIRTLIPSQSGSANVITRTRVLEVEP